MTVLATELPPVYFVLNLLGYSIFALSCAAVVTGLMFLLFKLFDKRRR